MDLSEDRQWLDDFRAGKKPALARVFTTYAPVVLAFARGHLVRLGAVQDAPDVVQEVFLRALQPALRARYDGLRPYAGFLAGVTRNVVLERARGGGSREVPTEEPHQHHLESWTPGQALPDELFLAAEEQALVRAFMQQRPPEERLLITTRFVEGASQRDAADALGITRQTVRTLEDRVRTALRAFLKKSAQEKSTQDPPRPQ